jgi:hypothetical protein
VIGMQVGVNFGSSSQFHAQRSAVYGRVREFVDGQWL